MGLSDALRGNRILNPVGGCNTCPRRLVDFVGPVLNDTRIVVVGEAPGRQEVQQGVPFVGPSGRRLDAALRAVGITDYSKTNVVHCHPPGNKTPGAREVSCCMAQYTMREVGRYAVAVLCGSVPMRAFFPGVRAHNLRGNVVHHPDFPGTRFYGLYHPVGVMRRPELDGEWRRHIERLARIVDEPPEPPFRVRTPSDSDWMSTLRNALSGHDVISFDVETTGLESWRPDSRITSWALCVDDSEAWFIDADSPRWEEANRELVEWFRVDDHGVIGHHVGFDLAFFERMVGQHVRVRFVLDTGVLWHHVALYKMPTLKYLTSKELDGYRYMVPDPRTADATLVQLYNAEDVVRAYQLYRLGVSRLSPAQLDLYLRVAGPSDLYLERIRANGIHIRADYLLQTKSKLIDERNRHIEEWQKEDPEFRPELHLTKKGAVGPRFASYLYEVKGWQPAFLTAHGTRSTDRRALQQLYRAGARQLRHALAVRLIDKKLTSFVYPFERYLSEDGRAHGGYQNTWVDNGRFSCRNPNLQAIPRDPEIRAIFGAPPGRVFLEADLSQIEFRIGVCLAGQRDAIEAYQHGVDFHTQTAIALTGKPAEQLTKEDRTNGKRLNFAMLTGGGWKTAFMQASEAGLWWTEEQAREFTRAWHQRWNKMTEWHQRTREDLMRNKGWQEQVTGHRHYHAGWDSDDPEVVNHAVRAAINVSVQGPASWMMAYLGWLTQRRVLDAGYDAMAWVNTVHDSVECELASEQVARRIVQIMEEEKVKVCQWASWFETPLVIEYAIGTDWGHLRQIELPGM